MGCKMGLLGLVMVTMLVVVGYTKGASIPECCKEKRVGGVSYMLLKESDTGGYGCHSNCVFEKVDSPGSRFCFKKGDLEVACKGDDEGGVEDCESKCEHAMKIIETSGSSTESIKAQVDILTNGTKNICDGWENPTTCREELPGYWTELAPKLYKHAYATQSWCDACKDSTEMTCPICRDILANVIEKFTKDEIIQGLAADVLLYNPSYVEASSPFIISDLLAAALPALSISSNEEEIAFCQYVLDVC